MLGFIIHLGTDAVMTARLFNHKPNLFTISGLFTIKMNQFLIEDL